MIHRVADKRRFNFREMGHGSQVKLIATLHVKGKLARDHCRRRKQGRRQAVQRSHRERDVSSRLKKRRISRFSCRSFSFATTASSSSSRLLIAAYRGFGLTELARLISRTGGQLNATNRPRCPASTTISLRTHGFIYSPYAESRVRITRAV